MIMKHKLLKPIEVDGEKIEEIKLDFSNQTGVDIMKIEMEMKVEGQGTIGIDNTNFIMRLAAKAADMFPEDIKKLSVGDFMEVFYLTRNFMLGYGVTEESESSESSSGDSDNNSLESPTGNEKA